MVGGGADAPPPSGIRPLADPKDTAFFYFEITIFGNGHSLKLFYRRLWRQLILILRGEREIFPKCQKMPFLAYFFFKILPALAKTGFFKVLLALWERSENQFRRPKKKADKIFDIFF